MAAQAYREGGSGATRAASSAACHRFVLTAILLRPLLVDADLSFRLKRHGWKLTVVGTPLSNMKIERAPLAIGLHENRYVTASGVRFQCAYSPAPALPYRYS